MQITPAVWAVGGRVCCFYFVCLSVAFRLRQTIGMTWMSAIAKLTILANDFYWRTASTVSGPSGFRGLGMADPQSISMHEYAY